VQTEADAGEAQVEEAGETAEAEQETPVVEEVETVPSWLWLGQKALHRAMVLVRDRARQALGMVRSIGERVVEMARAGVNTATDVIRSMAAGVAGMVTGLLVQMQGMVGAIISRAQALAGEIREALGRAVDWVLSLMGDVGERIRNGVENFLRGAYRRLVPIVRTARQAAERALTRMTNSVVAAVRARGLQLRAVLRRIITQVLQLLRELRNAVREAIDGVLNGEPPAPEAARRWVLDRLRRSGATVLQVVSESLHRASTAGINGARTAIRAILDPVRGAYTMVRDFLRLNIGPVLESAREYTPEITQELEIAGAAGEMAVTTIDGAIESEIALTEVAAQDGAASVEAEISSMVEG